MQDLDVNGYGQLNLLEACRRINRTARVIFSSSRLVYGPTDRLPVNEEAGLIPLSVYGAHKLLGECYHRVYARVHGVPTVILRITNPYGPYQDDDRTYGIVNMFIRAAVAGRPLTVFGDGEQLRDFVHVDDVVRAFLLAGMTDSANGDAINIGGGQAVRFKDMADDIVRITGRGSVQYQAWPADAAAAETGSFVANIEAAAQQLGWRPQIPFAAGLESAIRCYEEGLTT
jgi:nucleoside-diphosphate-sugar epimerase